MHPHAIQILYGLPIPPSQVERLAKLAQRLGPGSISVIIDHVGQIPPLTGFHKLTNWPVKAFVKVDTGYHRAGVKATLDHSSSFRELICSLLSNACKDTVKLHGLYSHAGHSYSFKSAQQCIELLMAEIDGLVSAAKLVANVVEELGQNQRDLDLTLSVGATPTVSTLEHNGKVNEYQDPSQISLQDLVNASKSELAKVLPRASLELHAGCFSFLDLQQIATKAGVSPASKLSNTLSDIGITILAEVNSLYSDRNPPEASIAAGTLAIGREPCQSYHGWGIVSDWESGIDTVEGHSGWIVGRVSQEHGMLELMSEIPGITMNVSTPMALSVGQKVRVWPNHACIAGAGFNYYVIVDSSLPPGRKNEVVDVWPRCNGW